MIFSDVSRLVQPRHNAQGAIDHLLNICCKNRYWPQVARHVGQADILAEQIRATINDVASS